MDDGASIELTQSSSRRVVGRTTKGNTHRRWLVAPPAAGGVSRGSLLFGESSS